MNDCVWKQLVLPVSLMQWLLMVPFPTDGQDLGSEDPVIHFKDPSLIIMTFSSLVHVSCTAFVEDAS